MRETNNAGCRECRYYLHTVSECLKENRRGDLIRYGLIGECSEFKEIQQRGLSSAESASSNDLLCVFDEALEYMPYLQLEIGYTRTTDWMVHVYNTAGGNSVKVLTEQEVTREDACRFAAIALRKYFTEKTRYNI